MKIFDKRPLSLILCIMLLSFVIFSFLSSVYKFILPVLILFVLIFSILSSVRILKSKLLRISLICSLISMLFSFLYFDCYYLAYERYDGIVEINGVITEFENSDYGKNVDIKASEVDGDFCSSYLFRAYLNFDDATNLSRGSRVKIKAKIVNFSEGNGFSDNTYYISEGYSGLISDIKSIEYIGQSENKLDDFIRNIRTSLKIDFHAAVEDDVAGLLTALFIGDKDTLNPQISLDFKRIGISHILALSGMHLAILILSFSKLMSKIGVNKKLASVLTILITVFYILLTGFSRSVMRAGIMLIICLLLYLFSYKHDSVTSLFLSLALITLFEPYAALSLSLWLSALATFGILGIVSYNEPNTDNSLNRGYSLIHSLLVSLFAIYMTMLVSSIYFDTITYLSPITTLIFSPLIEMLLLSVIPMLIFPHFKLLLKFVNFIGRSIINLAHGISDFKYSCASSRHLLTIILIYIFTVLVILFLVLDIKRKRTVISGLFAFYTVIQISALLLTYQSANTENFDYYSIEESESVFISGDGESTVIAINTDSHSSLDLLSKISNEYRLTNIDNFVIPHYSNGLPRYISKLLSILDVNRIYIPMPRSQTEHLKCDEILKIIKNYRAEIILYDMHKVLVFGNYSYFLSENRTDEVLEESELLFGIFKGERLYTYLNTNVLDGSTQAIAKELISESDTLIIGNWASREYRFNYKIPNIRRLIFSDRKIIMGEDVYSFYKYQDLHFYPEHIKLLE